MFKQLSKEEVLEEVKAQGDDTYLEVKYLEDGSIAMLVELAFTRAICLGTTLECPFESRFCFSDRALATKRFAELKTEDDVPEGYIARRPEYKNGIRTY